MQTLEQHVKGAKSIRGMEVFLFTDNVEAENLYYKGNSSNPHFFDLILCLLVLVTTTDIILHLIHITRVRMKECCIDVCQGGIAMEGITQWKPLYYFVPLNILCVDTVSKLK